MSKCKTVQDEKKILELSVRQKSDDQVIEKKVLKSVENVSDISNK